MKQSLMKDTEYEDSPQKILVVDDDEDSRYVTRQRLLRIGYFVDEAADGEEAWEALLAVRYDLLLTDHNMPRLCGLDLVARMRAAGMRLPVILHSGWPGLKDSTDYPDLHLSAVIRKSSNFTEIQGAVLRILPVPSLSLTLGSNLSFEHYAKRSSPTCTPNNTGVITGGLCVRQ
jgi:CheY-like chemotaxis protein